jgi:hypothetical protein
MSAIAARKRTAVERPLEGEERWVIPNATCDAKGSLLLVVAG